MLLSPVPPMSPREGEWGDEKQTWEHALNRVLSVQPGETKPWHWDDGFREAWYLAHELHALKSREAVLVSALEGLIGWFDADSQEPEVLKARDALAALKEP